MNQMDCSGSNSATIRRLWHKTRVLVQKGRTMTEGGVTSPLPSPGAGPLPSAGFPLNRALSSGAGSVSPPAAQPVPAGGLPLNRAVSAECGPVSRTAQGTNTTQYAQHSSGSSRFSLDPKHLQQNQAGLDAMSQSDSCASQDKTTNVHRSTSNTTKPKRPCSLVTDSTSIVTSKPGRLATDSAPVVTKQRSSSQGSEMPPGELKNMELMSTRSGSTSSYVMVSGIEGRRVDSGYHSVGGGDQILRSTEDERRAPIAEITEFSLTPDEPSEAPTPEFIFTTATPPSLPQSPISEEFNSEREPPLHMPQSSVKPKPCNLTLTDTEPSAEPKKARGLVSSHDSLSPRRLRPKNVRRKHTVSGVTEEARVVLEQLLRRSYSHNDASPRNTLQNEYVGISEMTVIEEQPRAANNDVDEAEKPLTSPRSPRSPMARNRSYQAATGHTQGGMGGASGPPPKSDSFDFMAYDDDDLTSHSPMSKTNSIISGSSRSSSFKHRYVVRPLPTEEVEAALKGNLRKKTKVKRRQRKDSTSCSSSDSDYDAFNTNSGVRRKKSFFKRASERLRQSFRMTKARQKDQDDLSDNEKGKYEPRKRKSPKNRKSRADGKAPSDDIIHTHVHKHIHQEQNKTQNGAVVVLHTEDIDIIQDSAKDDQHVEVKLHTKESWPKEKEKKSLWDNILQKIRKGGHKMQKKGSTKGKGPRLQERSRSADALQYVSVNQNDQAFETVSQGGDRKRRITHSFREIFGGGSRRKSDSGENKVSSAAGSSSNVPMIVRPALPPLPHLPPPPGASTSAGYYASDGGGDGRHDLRQRMRLDGLVANQPNVPGGAGTYDVDIDVDRYDRIIHTQDGDRTLPMRVVRQQNFTFPDSFDDVDNSVSPEFRQAVADNCDKPFELRTETEKEEMYEKIAEQLAMIADSYDFNSKFAGGPIAPPPSKTSGLFVAPAPTPATGVVSPADSDEVFSSSVDPPSLGQISGASGASATGIDIGPEVVVDSGSPVRSGAQSPAVEGAVGGITGSANLLSPTPSLNYEARRAHSIERKIGAILRDKGDKHHEDMPDMKPVVTEIVRGAGYNKFYNLLATNLGQEPGWQQLAVMFKLTQSAVQVAGMGTAAALHIKEMSLRYFEDKFAGWIVGQGGWESMVSDTDLSSEVD